MWLRHDHNSPLAAWRKPSGVPTPGADAPLAAWRQRPPQRGDTQCPQTTDSLFVPPQGEQACASKPRGVRTRRLTAHHNAPLTARSPRPSIDRLRHQHRPGMLAAGRATRRRTCHQGGSRGSSPRPTQTRDAGCGPCNPTADMPSGGFRGIVPLVDTDSAAGDGEFGDGVVPAALEIAVWESDGAGAVGVASRHA